MNNLKQENNYEKFKLDVDMWINNTQYWINSYSKRASVYINHPSLIQNTTSYLNKIGYLHSQLIELKDLSKMNIDEWFQWRNGQ